ncbi:MAG TPA: hypothetical protein VFS16_01910, partial [Acidimicrobiia bacterium]|nr:hypothetical protein [Acidimicrobiia bacterium]
GARKILTDAGVSARVVSMPCWELFEQLSPDERAEVLPRHVPTLAVEAAATLGWERFADDVVGLDRFGASAPGGVALNNLGFSAENVAVRALSLLNPGAPEPDLPPGLGGADAERSEQP